MDGFVVAMIAFIILVVVIVLIIRARILRAEALKAAYNTYQKALVALKREPTSPDRKQGALEAGRVYVTLARESGGRTLFDEVALGNDIAAATAGASVQASMPAVAAKSDIPQRLAKLDTLKAQGLITEAEHTTQRAKILADI